MSLPWKALLNEMGRVSILEIGCGSGVYGRLLEKLLGESFKQYVGVDIEANDQWKIYSSNASHFKIGRACDAYKFLPDSNLIITQSALEHFYEDFLYFRQVSSYVLANKSPILQVHVIPAASCIKTFPWHGVREYTPRTISKITRLFGIETKVYLFSLGGSGCNRIHRKFITWPNLKHGVDLRRTYKMKYRRDLLSAIVSDFNRTAKTLLFMP